MNLIPIEVPMTVSVDRVLIPMNIETQPELAMTIGASYAMSTADDYEGAYEFTPTESTQTVAIEGMKATQDIVINPIPTNYGRITWDGSKITVS